MKPMPDKVVQTMSDQASIVRPLQDTKSSQAPMAKKYILTVYFIVVLLGVGTGYMLSQRGAPMFSATGSDSSTASSSEKSVGSSDTTTFKDSAVGKIQKGGLNGEGTHQLIREGGPSQTVYLISSVVDLDQFVGKNVKVWGQTMAAQKAAWLMDVGKIEME